MCDVLQGKWGVSVTEHLGESETVLLGNFDSFDLSNANDFMER